MLKGFRDFIMRGNVIDLAVAVVIGAAFIDLVKSITDAAITPFVNRLLGAMGLGSDGVPGTIDIGEGQAVNLGAIIGAIITFVITALVVYYVFVAPMNKIKELRGAEDEDEEQIILLRDIRDSLRGDGPEQVGTANTPDP